MASPHGGHTKQLIAQQITHAGAKGSLKAIELGAKLTGQASGSDPAPVAPQETLALDEDAISTHS